MAKDDVRSFVKKVEAFAEVFAIRIEDVILKLSLEALDGLLRRSPVDEGRFRASWRVSVNEPDLTVYREGGRPDKTGSSAFADGVEKIRKVRGDKTIHFSNNLPYAQPLEDGHSSQALDGILIPTFMELSQNLATVVRLAKAAVPDA